MIRICSNSFCSCPVSPSILLFLTCLTFYVKPVKLISPFKPFFNHWITEAVRGFPSPCLRGRKVGLYECLFVKFHLISLWRMEGTHLVWFLIAPFIVHTPDLTYGVPPSLGSNVQTYNLSLCQRGQPPAVSTGWTMGFQSEADWIPKQYECTPSPTAVLSAKARQKLDMAFSEMVI